MVVVYSELDSAGERAEARRSEIEADGAIPNLANQESHRAMAKRCLGNSGIRMAYHHIVLKEKGLMAIRHKSFSHLKYRRWDLNPHPLAGTGF
jgi:hypothetical protein